jgi:hypothetical protein
MDDTRTPERKRLDAWSAEHPRDDLALVLLAAWVNSTPDKLPPEMRTHTCEATMKAWQRVADAARVALFPEPKAAATTSDMVERVAAIIRDNLSGPIFEESHIQADHLKDVRLTAELILRAVKPAAPATEPVAWAKVVADKAQTARDVFSGTCDTAKQAIDYLEQLMLAANPTDADLQSRVKPWMDACFGEEISNDRLERGDRLLEEVFELLQSGQYPRDRVASLASYVWSRPAGEPSQEVGGVMITLAAYCLAHGLDMHAAGEAELARIWTKVDVIRAKQAAKPKGSALPQAWPVAEASADADLRAEVERLRKDADALRVALSEARDQGRDPDYCYDDEWEYTMRWDEWPDLVDGHDLTNPTPVHTLYKGPTKWVVRITTDDDSEMRLFDSEAAARAALGEPRHG